MAAPKTKRNCQYVFTQELADDRQAAVLYSPFRDKALNPHSWDRKMTFWERLLLKTFMEQRMISFDLSKLPEMFERNGLTPKCLTIVVEQMKSSGKLQPVSHYQKNNSWLSWGFNTLVKQPMYWSVTQLIGSPKKDAGVFVCPNVVKAIAGEILQLHQSGEQYSVVDSLISLDQFKQSSQDLVPENEDFQIILTYLERENHIAVSQTNSGDFIVKFRREGESSVCIREFDLNMYSIKTAVEKLEKEVHVLMTRVDGHLQEAKLHVKNGKKKMALICLRRKASLLKLVDTKSGSLTRLHEIMHKIEEASSNEMIVRACEAGVQAMKSLNLEVTAERAESVMDEMHEAMGLQEEVNDILSTPISQTDEEELERSLEELLKEEDQEQEVRGKDLPSMPSNQEIPFPEAAAPTQVSDDIANAFLALQLEDLDLPDVPTHSPHKESARNKKTDTPSKVPGS
ncbi:hypothetical protein EGW08_004466 [Elysia chlorotica]|uniref:CHMP7 winged helix domain-containing protein n=1 Tax=Elysia chlorotica TaxID=188477 RepID=A0A433U1V7_ELYCH|nr:hypothetical protein EGW08_004466 [Elysia chlorotica]